MSENLEEEEKHFNLQISKFKGLQPKRIHSKTFLDWCELVSYFWF